MIKVFIIELSVIKDDDFNEILVALCEIECLAFFKSNDLI